MSLTPFWAWPAVHFLVLGGLLYGARVVTDDGRTLGFGADPIVVTATDVERLRAEWVSDTGRAPGAADLDAQVRRLADDEILYREALRLGLDRSDAVVRTRLVQNMRFVHGEPAAGASEDDLYREALALRLPQHDVVVRRRLIEALQERIAAGVRVSERDVRQFVAMRADRYAAPARVRFRQVFVDGERHADVDAAAREVQQRLAAGGDAPSDPFLLGLDVPWTSAPELERRFGAAFAQTVLAAPAGQWSAPIRSTYGVHFVRVEGREAAAPPDFAAIGRQAYYALLEEREQQAVRATVEKLRKHYPVVREPETVAVVAQP